MTAHSSALTPLWQTLLDARLLRDLDVQLAAAALVHLHVRAVLALHARAVPQAEVHRLEGRDHQLGDDLREVADVVRTL